MRTIQNIGYSKLECRETQTDTIGGIMNILITGFEPFAGEHINPSSEVIKVLPDEIQGAKIIKAFVPTALESSISLLKEIIDAKKPDVVINLGQAGGHMKSEINLERIAINICDFSIPDNNNHQPVDQRIIEDAPDGYFLSLPIRAILNELHEHHIPTTISNSAGTYICNYVAFHMAHLAKTQYPHMKTGFIHLPYLPEQVINKAHIPHMSLDMMAEAIKLAIRTCVSEIR